jgi:hypothetical protein
MDRTNKLLEILKPPIKLSVGIGALFVIKVLIAIAFPSFEEGAPNFLSHVKSISALIVNTLILFMLINFGRESRKVLNKIADERCWGDFAFFITLIIVAASAHWVFKGVFQELLGRDFYIYSLVFLIFSAALIVILGVRIYKNLDMMASLLIEKIKNIPDIIKKLENQNLK